MSLCNYDSYCYSLISISDWKLLQLILLCTFHSLVSRNWLEQIFIICSNFCLLCLFWTTNNHAVFVFVFFLNLINHNAKPSLFSQMVSNHHPVLTRSPQQVCILPDSWFFSDMLLLSTVSAGIVPQVVFHIFALNCPPKHTCLAFELVFTKIPENYY